MIYLCNIEDIPPDEDPPNGYGKGVTPITPAVTPDTTFGKRH
jgi:hypothetical protein